MQLSTSESSPAQNPERESSTLGIHEGAIEGGFRQITTHQLCLAWWLHSAGHMTRRQLRVWFAAHEMAERRRLSDQEARTREERDRRPLYSLHELKTLVGGRGSPSADAELSADLRHLAKLGLVHMEDHAIRFAVSADQIAIEDLSGFWALFAQMPHQRRTVPVPRRTLRALAGGFSRAVTGVMIALMIRSLFWRKESGDYRIDGRTKGSWIADVFGLSRRAVTNARAHLIDLGWLEALDASQWELNRWGAHDRIHVEWSPAMRRKADLAAEPEAVGEGGESDEPAETEAGQGAESASPASDNPSESASPIINNSPFPSEKNLKTRRPDPGSDPAGVLKPVSAKEQKAEPAGPVSLRNIQTAHLQDNGCLLELYGQAVADGQIPGSEAGRLDFFALAERALSRGHNSGALFHWLLRHKRFDFITQADEDAAAERLRALRQGPREDYRRQGGEAPPPLPPVSETDKVVQACLAVAEKRGMADPFGVARLVRPQWTREEWDDAVMAYETARMARLTPCQN